MRNQKVMAGSSQFSKSFFSSFVSHLQCILGAHGQHAKLIAVDLFCRRGGVEHNMGEKMAESVESDSL